MNEFRKTTIYVAGALVLTALAVITAPRKITPNAFLDQGEAFFPDFTDPNAARTLEVIDFDEQTGTAVPFKVTFSGKRWSIPSHYDYPADGKDRLARTAAAVIQVKKDDFRSDNAADHEACRVIDPLDETATSLVGRGQRVTIKGENDVVLADMIIGKPVEGRDNFRFVRVPGQKRVYAARMDIDISTRFSDWIESDLLLVDKTKINEVTLKDYSINERTGSLNTRDELTLRKTDDTWTADRMNGNQEVETAKISQFLAALDTLKIVGVRPKPRGLTASLTRSSDSLRITTEDVLSLQSKGYFFSRDGRLLSNEGELQARTSDGVAYTLRFGEIVSGTGLAVTAGSRSTSQQSGPGENRYLFISTTFDPSIFPEPGRPSNMEFQAKPDSLWSDADRANWRLYNTHKRWEDGIAFGRKTSDDLNARFAKWYYVISSKSFDALHLTRSDLIREKQS